MPTICSSSTRSKGWSRYCAKRSASSAASAGAVSPSKRSSARTHHSRDQSSRLQRERNLEADPRATLLVEHWDRDDWSRLWWVRAELRFEGHAEPALADRLAERFEQYRDQPFDRVLLLRIVGITGWAAKA